MSTPLSPSIARKGERRFHAKMRGREDSKLNAPQPSDLFFLLRAFA
jgi:hypothetical protein